MLKGGSRKAGAVFALLLFMALVIRLLANDGIGLSAHEYEYFVTPCGEMYPSRHVITRQTLCVGSIAPRFHTSTSVHLREDKVESNGFVFGWIVQHVLVHFCFKDYDGQALRVLPLLCGLTSLYLVYVLGTMVHSRSAGLYATFFLAIHGMHITHSVHARFYTISEMFCLLSTILVLKLAEKPKARWAVAYIITVLLVVSTQLLSTLIVVPQFVYLVVFSSDKRRGWGYGLLALLLAGALFVGLCWRDSAGYGRFDYGYPLDNAVYVRFWLCLTASNLFGDVVFADGFAPVVPYTRQVISGYLTAMMGLTWLALWVAYERRHRPDGRRLLVVWGLRIFILVFYWVFATYVKNMVVTRNYSWLIPFFSVLTAVGFARLSRLGRYAFLALAFCASNYFCACLYFQGRGEDFLLDIVRNYRRPGELVVADDWIKLNRRHRDGDYLVPPAVIRSPLRFTEYMLNPEHLGQDVDGTRETMVPYRLVPSVLRCMRLYDGPFLRGKRVWIIAHNVGQLMACCYGPRDKVARVLLYRDCGSEAIYYVEFAR